MAVDAERRALDLFEQWLDLESGERELWLDTETTGDPELRAATDRLIAAHSQAEMLSTIPPEPIDPLALRAAPDRIGAWRLIAPIGQGGMGTVYRAERADGLFAQTAAIKLIRPGLFSARSNKQFAKEREILAGLQHPHIARLYDGGTSDDGHSYFVMELIDGLPLIEHCNANDLPLKDRISFFEKLCEAVQFAHQNLVVHADLKPSNVLVEKGVGPKLLDFGISHLSSDHEGDGTGRSGLTLRYASPQMQAGARAVPADDIYALGVLLADLSDGLGVDSELAAIIERARAWEAEGRYPSAMALGDDLQRWSGGYPVQAIAPSSRRTFSHFMRRNRTMVAAASAAVLLIVGTSGYAFNRSIVADKRYAETQSMTRYLLGDVVTQSRPLPGSGDMRLAIARRALGALEGLGSLDNAREDLRLDFADAYLVIGEILSSPDAESVESSSKKALDAVVKARQLYATGYSDAGRAQHAKEWDVRAMVKEARLRGLANSEEKAALALLDKAQLRLDGWIGFSPDNADALLLRAETDVLRAAIGGMTNDYPGAIVASKSAIGLLDRIRATTDGQRVDATLLRDQAWAEIGDARWYGDDDKKGAAVAYKAALAAHDAPGLPADARLSRRKAHAVFNLASTIYELGKKDEADGLMQTALSDITAFRRFDDSPAVRQQENTLTMEYANQLAANQRLAEARIWYARSIAGRRAIAAREGANYNTARSLPVGLRVAGLFEWSTGNRTGGCKMLAEAQSFWEAFEKQGRLADFDRTDAAAQTADALKRCQ